MSGARFPFAAVVGSDDAKLALLLHAVDPRIGGVLFRGDKGSAKSTLARGFADVLAEEAPFVELPVGATEDRVVGSIDLGAALAGEGVRVLPGLLAEAHGGVLYVDEVNLLPDHLVDVLLDVAASGVNRIERDGVSHSHPSRFVLVGSMNPEEGELRPQLLDRFGLAVDVVTTTDAETRALAVRRRLGFDADPAGFLAGWAAEAGDARASVASARPARLPEDLLLVVSRLCAAVGAEGLRADLAICRAAAALAGLESRVEAGEDDVRRVAAMALAHRRRRSPFEEPGIQAEEIEQALASAGDEPPPSDGEESSDGERSGGGAGEGEGGGEGRVAPPGAIPTVAHLVAGRSTGASASGRRSVVVGERGRAVGDRTPEPGRPPTTVAAAGTIRAAAIRNGSTGAVVAVRPTDLRESIREQQAANLIVLAVDASASMGAERRMEAVKGAAIGLLLDAYQRRDRVALVTFHGEGAEVALRPTGSVEVARARLASLPTGGRTPLAAGIECALGIATAAAAGPRRPVLVLVTDGRATFAAGGQDPVAAALDVAGAVRHRGDDAVVVDAEDGAIRLGLAAPLAAAMGARHLALPDLSAGSLLRAVSGALR